MVRCGPCTTFRPLSIPDSSLVLFKSSLACLSEPILSLDHLLCRTASSAQLIVSRFTLSCCHLTSHTVSVLNCLCAWKWDLIPVRCEQAGSPSEQFPLSFNRSRPQLTKFHGTLLPVQFATLRLVLSVDPSAKALRILCYRVRELSPR
jgi:hypothetical protein